MELKKAPIKFDNPIVIISWDASTVEVPAKFLAIVICSIMANNGRTTRAEASILMMSIRLSRRVLLFSVYSTVKFGAAKEGRPGVISPTTFTGTGFPMKVKTTVATTTTIALREVDMSHRTLSRVGQHFEKHLKISCNFYKETTDKATSGLCYGEKS